MDTTKLERYTRNVAVIEGLDEVRVAIERALRLEQFNAEEKTKLRAAIVSLGEVIDTAAARELEARREIEQDALAQREP